MLNGPIYESKRGKIGKICPSAPAPGSNFSQVSLHLENFPKKVDSQTSYISKYFMFTSILEIENYQFRSEHLRSRWYFKLVWIWTCYNFTRLGYRTAGTYNVSYFLKEKCTTKSILTILCGFTHRRIYLIITYTQTDHIVFLLSCTSQCGIYVAYTINSSRSCSIILRRDL